MKSRKHADPEAWVVPRKQHTYWERHDGTANGKRCCGAVVLYCNQTILCIIHFFRPVYWKHKSSLSFSNMYFLLYGLQKFYRIVRYTAGKYCVWVFLRPKVKITWYQVRIQYDIRTKTIGCCVFSAQS